MSPHLKQAIARRKEVVGRVKEILIEGLNLELETDEISEDSALFGFGLGLDSIDALTLTVALEDRLEIAIPTESSLHIFRSVNTIADFVINNSSAHENPQESAA